MRKTVPFPLLLFHEMALEIPDQEDAHIWQHATDPDHIGFRVPDADAPLRPLHQSMQCAHTNLASMDAPEPSEEGAEPFDFVLDRHPDGLYMDLHAVA